MKALANIFLKGLLVVLPLAITFGLLYWLLETFEQLLSVPLRAMLPEGWYITGMSIVFAVALIFVCGILVQTYFTKHFFQWLEWLLSKIPLVKTFYGGSKDIMQFAFGNRTQGMSKVVSVEIADNVRLIGFITRENVSLEGGEGELLAVYFPLSYQIGGHLVYVPREKCLALDLTVEKALQQIFTAHITQSKSS